MENSIKIVDEEDIGYSRQRMKNRVYSQLVAFFEEEAVNRGITKRDLAIALKKDAGQLNRILKHPSNLTLETISDLLVALDAEMDTRIVRFSERLPTNYMHPLLAKIRNIDNVTSEPLPVAPVLPTANSSRTATFVKVPLDA